jgi:glycosyltransferase involved in cell wall biosynthesis
MTGTPAPLTIGLPVRNGARYLGEAIDSIRKQEFTDFEVLVADNASTDETGDIVRAVVEADSRFRYVRHERNIGLIQNWNYLFAHTDSKLFAWMGADDRSDPRLYDRCVKMLAARPDASGAFGQSGKIDSEGNMYDLAPEPARGDHPDPVVRFADFASYTRHQCQMCFAVWRREALAKVRPMMLFPGSDRLLFAELALRGRFVRDPEVLFFNRNHDGRSSWNHYSKFYADAGVVNGPRAVRVHYLRQLWRALSEPDIPSDVRRRASVRLMEFSARNSMSLARSAGSATRDSLRERLTAHSTH